MKIKSQDIIKGSNHLWLPYTQMKNHLPQLEVVNCKGSEIFLSDNSKLIDGIASVMDTYGKSNRNKYRAVVYYMLTKHFGKESIY